MLHSNRVIVGKLHLDSLYVVCLSMKFHENLMHACPEFRGPSLLFDGQFMLIRRALFWRKAIFFLHQDNRHTRVCNRLGPCVSEENNDQFV